MTLILDMQPEAFLQLQGAFIQGLAAALEVGPEEFEITSVRYGCTKVTLQMNSELAAKLLEYANSDESSDSKFLAHFRVRSGFFSEHYVLIRKDGRELTWLHISDVHLETSTGSHGGSQDRVSQAFLHELPSILEEDDLKPDAVFVTGDISRSGNVSEFQKALEFFGKLKDVLPNKSAPIMCVPGNHDVDRNTAIRFHREEDDAKNRLTRNEAVIDYLTSPKYKDDRERVLARLDNYRNFIDQCSALGHPPINHGYFYTTELKHKGCRFGVAGMNSAWRCSSDDDRGKLVLGVPQIDTCIDALRGADLRVLLLHHPVDSDWFVREDIVYQRAKLGSFHFVLRGHEHDPHGATLSQLDGQPNFRFAAGALYTHEDYPKSFNVVRLNLDQGSARLFYWRLSAGKMEWVPDVDFHRRGSVQFLLGQQMKSRLAGRSH